MHPLLKEIRHNPMLWLLAFVPVVFAAALPSPVELSFVDENRVELATDDRPDPVALSVMLSSQNPRGKESAAEYRRHGVEVIAGGIAVMLHAAEMCAAGSVVVRPRAVAQASMNELLRRGVGAGWLGRLGTVW